MCDVLTLPAEESVGRLWRLCGDFGSCVAKLLQPGELEPRGPAKRLFESYAPAAVAVVEGNYFDLDYRSEFTATHETSFSVREAVTARVHFFGGDELTGTSPMRTLVEERALEYRGYVVVRPQYGGMIGRSIVPPDGDMPELNASTHRARHVRTAVREEVNLFGVPLRAIGVPFMEQDGHLLRCVHVGAWMCHYTSTLRGLVSRRPSAHFHRVTDDVGAYGRAYPSLGLSPYGLSSLLGKVDLPPEIIDTALLGNERQPEWYDRGELWEAVKTGEDERAILWFSENLTASICRYVNSGIPCIVGDDAKSHTYVVYGYLRDEDLTDEALGERSPRDPAHSDVVAFLVGDDQVGPYSLLWVRDLVDPGRDPRSVTVVVPLPHALWLSGDHAERRGASVFRRLVAKRLERLDAWAEQHELDEDQVTASRAALTDMHECVESEGGSRLAIRSYAAMGTDFKTRFAEELKLNNDESAIRVAGYTPMPKYVWVVEVIDRELRATRRPGVDDKVPAVRGTVVLDASVPGESSFYGADESGVLLVHIPGQISQIRQDPLADQNWEPTTLKPYFTGRWDPYLDRPEMAAARSKIALPGERSHLS